MNVLVRIATAQSERARSRRAAVFRQRFEIEPSTKVLDLGSETGRHIHQVLAGSQIKPENVYIADIDGESVAEGNRRFGFTPVVIDESGELPFPDQFFDIVYCSSVIEHVTIPKSDVWTLRSGSEFKELSHVAQYNFAREVQRLGRQYYVQTPNKWFPVESHSWLPFFGWLPRRLLIRLLRITNTFWVKKTSPDWHLLDERGLSHLFDGAPIIKERSMGMVKSVTACKAISSRDVPTR